MINTFIHVIFVGRGSCRCRNKSAPPRVQSLQSPPDGKAFASFGRTDEEGSETWHSIASTSAASTRDSSLVRTPSDASDKEHPRKQREGASEAHSPSQRLKLNLASALPVHQGRPRLRVAAKAFVSKASAAHSNAQGNLQLQGPCRALRGALLASGLQNVSLSLNGERCAVVATMPAGADAQREYYYGAAKSAMLKLCEWEDGLCVLGSKAKPFMQTPSGFLAEMCTVNDPASTCWDFVSKGFCHRGCRCQWQHPANVMPVSVSIVQSR